MGPHWWPAEDVPPPGGSQQASGQMCRLAFLGHSRRMSATRAASQFPLIPMSDAAPTLGPKGGRQTETFPQKCRQNRHGQLSRKSCESDRELRMSSRRLQHGERPGTWKPDQPEVEAQCAATLSDQTVAQTPPSPTPTCKEMPTQRTEPLALWPPTPTPVKGRTYEAAPGPEGSLISRLLRAWGSC